MKLESMHITFNKYDFENDGIPAKSHGGKAYFATPNGKLEVQLSADAVASMIKTISVTVVNACRELSSVSVASVEASVSNNLLGHDIIVDAEFQDSGMPF